MIQWRSKDKIKWIAWREKFSWIRFICKNTFLPRINSPAYSCQMCEAIRGPLQKKKKGKYRRKIVNTAEEDVSIILGRDICTFRCYVSRRMVRIAATKALVSLDLSPFYCVTPRVVIYLYVRNFFLKKPVTLVQGARNNGKRDRETRFLNIFIIDRDYIFFFLFFLSKISFFLRVMEKIKKKFPGVDPGIPRICICMIITS